MHTLPNEFLAVILTFQPMLWPGFTRVLRALELSLSLLLRWAKSGHWQAIFETLQDLDLVWNMIDSTLVQAHQQAVCQKSTTQAEVSSSPKSGPVKSRA